MGFPDNNAEMFPVSSAVLYLTKNVPQCQDSSARMFPDRYRDRSAEMCPDKSAGMFPGKNANRCLGNSAKMCQGNSARMYLSRSARMFLASSARTCLDNSVNRCQDSSALPPSLPMVNNPSLTFHSSFLRQNVLISVFSPTFSSSTFSTLKTLFTIIATKKLIP